METRLPYYMDSMYTKHRKGMVKVVNWLKGLGLDISYETNILDTTCLDIHLRHANDYVECGGSYDDPDGVMFYCFTSQTVEFKVPCKIMTKVMQALKNHQGIGDKRIANNIAIHTDVTNQFTMQDHMFANDWKWEYIEMRIEFRVYHSWR